MTNVSLRTTDGADECNDTDDNGYPGFQADQTGGLQWGNKPVYAPRNTVVGLIFRSVSSPSGCTWDTVTNPPTLTINPAGTATGNPIELVVDGEESGTPSDWSDGNSPYDRTGSATAASVQWDVSPATDTPEETASLAAVLQEITDAVGAITDLALSVKQDQNSNTNRGTIDGYNDDSSACPLFDGDYTTGGGGGTAVPVFTHHLKTLSRA